MTMPEGTPTDDLDPAAGSPADTDTDTPPAEDADQADRKPMPREQRYRLQLRAAEAERDALREQVAKLQRAEVERLAGDLAVPADLFDLGRVTLADLITEAGEVDTEAIAEAVASLIEQRPGTARRPKVGATDPSQGMGLGRSKPPAPSWSDLVKS